MHFFLSPRRAGRKELPGKLAVLTPYFNPAGYQKLKENYLRFAESMRSQGADLWTVEVAFGEQQFFLPSSEKTLQIRTPDILWQKERALNVLAASLPVHAYDKVAWVDADVLFENSHWMADLARILEDVPVAQCFSSVSIFNRSNTFAALQRLSLAQAAGARNASMENLRVFQPGFAWAARRSLLSRCSLYDFLVVGGDDVLMATAFLGWNNHPDPRLMLSTQMYRHYAHWRKKAQKMAKGAVGCVEGRIFHLWHGHSANRQYLERYGYLKEHDFDCTKDIAIGKDGLWHWATDKPNLHARVRQFFLDRKDDG